MNNINTAPGFTAEASLYKSRGQYTARTSGLTLSEGRIFPQAKKITGTGAGKFKGICAEAGGLVNEAVEGMIDSAKNGHRDDAQEWRDLANEMISRSSKWGCSFKYS